MTEQEWMACPDLGRMLEFLRGKASDRKLRLFTVACCRTIWPLLQDERSRKAVEATERFAEGEAGLADLEAAANEAAAAAIDAQEFEAEHAGLDTMARKHAAAAARQLVEGVLVELRVTPAEAARLAACVDEDERIVAEATADPGVLKRYDLGGIETTLHEVREWAATSWAEYRAAREASTLAAEEAVSAAFLGRCAASHEAASESQASLLRDILGNPFRPVTLDTAWLTPTVTALARSVYEDRNFTDLPILADALEENGCTSQELLDHLRGPGPHVLGCWPLDLLLGKS
jgi:hypothetical protein